MDTAFTMGGVVWIIQNYRALIAECPWFLLYCKPSPCLAAWKRLCSCHPCLQILWIMSPGLVDMGLVTVLTEQENGRCFPLKIYLLE